MSMGIIILPGLPAGLPFCPEIVHSTRLLGGSGDVWDPVFPAGKEAALAYFCMKNDCGNPKLSREMKKRLLTTFLSQPGPQGPLKPEFDGSAIPHPCSPSKVTMSVSVRTESPVFKTPNIAAHPPAPLGKVVSVGLLFDKRAAGLPATKGTPLQVGVTPLLLMPHPSALDSQSAQKSALVSLLKQEQQALRGLVRVVQTPVTTLTKPYRPRLSVLARLMEPSQPPMQSWKAARRNFLISIFLLGEATKKQPSITCSMVSISLGVKLVCVWTGCRQQTSSMTSRSKD